MPRSNRLGKYNATAHAPRAPKDDAVVPLHRSNNISTASYRGTTPPQLNTIEFGNLVEHPLLIANISKVYDEIFRGRSKATLDVLKKAIVEVSHFLTWLEQKQGIEIRSIDQINIHVTTMIYVYLEERRIQYRRLNFFRRVLRAMGVAESEIPVNIFLSDKAPSRALVPMADIVKLYTHCKAETTIIRNRLKEAATLTGGHDPRRDYGGRFGDWSDPKNRFYIITNVIGTDIKSVKSNRLKGHRTAVAGLEQYGGAMTLRVDGNHRRKKGVTGHLAWFYPSMRDLLPFVILLLIKTRFNVSVITGLRVGSYYFRPLALKFGGAERTVQFGAPKFKSVNDPNAEPSFVHAICLKKPYAHPFQVISTLQELTSPLREEIARQIGELRARIRTAPAETALLQKLEKIKNDLFIYYAQGEINSLRSYAETGDTPGVYALSLKNLGFDMSLMSIRSASIAFGTKLEGSTQSVITMLADHKSPRTEKHYRNRQQLHDEYQALFIDVFELSMSLIRANKFTKNNLKLLLEAQRLSANEVSNLLLEGRLTRWGNRCSDPYHPPTAFGHGTAPGQLCASQACIDGCSRARWFPEALDILKRRCQELLARVADLSLAATMQSSIHGRIERCEAIISEIEQAEGHQYDCNS